MVDQPMDYQPQPSLLQGAQDVHKPAAAAPGGFPDPDNLDLHYKLFHPSPYDVLGFEDSPLASPIFSTIEEHSQPLSSFGHDTNLDQNGFNAIGASLRGPFMGRMDYDDISVNEHDGGLLTHDANLRGAMHQSSSSLSLINNFAFINEPHTDASFSTGGDQFDTPALPSFVPTETVPTIVSPASLPTASIPPPAPTPQTPTTEALPPLRHVCPTCRKSCSRAPDLQRHARNHNPRAQRIDCPEPGCPYTGAKGFLRRDKLTSHQRNRH